MLLVVKCIDGSGFWLQFPVLCQVGKPVPFFCPGEGQEGRHLQLQLFFASFLFHQHTCYDVLSQGAEGGAARTTLPGIALKMLSLQQCL